MGSYMIWEILWKDAKSKKAFEKGFDGIKPRLLCSHFRDGGEVVYYMGYLGYAEIDEIIKKVKGIKMIRELALSDGTDWFTPDKFKGRKKK